MALSPIFGRKVEDVIDGVKFRDKILSASLPSIFVYGHIKLEFLTYNVFLCIPQMKKYSSFFST